jgi:hypothetical protein
MLGNLNSGEEIIVEREMGQMIPRGTSLAASARL